MAVNILSKNFMSMLSRRGYGPFRSNKLLADLYSTTNSTQVSYRWFLSRAEFLDSITFFILFLKCLLLSTSKF